MGCMLFSCFFISRDKLFELHFYCSILDQVKFSNVPLNIFKVNLNYSVHLHISSKNVSEKEDITEYGNIYMDFLFRSGVNKIFETTLG